MEAALVSVGTGVMRPLLSKLYKQLKEEQSKLKGVVGRQVEDIKNQMRSMAAALETLADAELLNREMRAWRDDVRELSYDMEDCVDDFMARVDHEHDRSTGWKKFFRMLKKLKPCREIAGEIEELKARAIEVSMRHQRYKLDHPPSDSITTDIDPRLHALYVEVGKLVGIDGPKKRIIEWYRNQGSCTQLRVVSIVGPGGLGKTTLANAVFQTIKSEFYCAAFVSVSRKPNMKNVLRDIAERVEITVKMENDDERRLIDRLREHLQDKKFLIVIDDIWRTEAWEIIRDALLNNNNGSRIITTTRNITVASFCSSQENYVYKMEPLNSADSRRLFLGRAFRSEDLFPPNLEEVCEKILEKCAGLPLAIITLSSLLADKTAEVEWNRVLDAIGSSLANEVDAGNMATILSLSYFDLPHPMRTCLLYLSAYPEDHIIEKRSLIQKWIAEGFIPGGQGRSTYEVGEGYFIDFINRSLIQGSAIEHIDGDVEACRVHDVILDFITCKAKDENFMISIGDDTEQGQKHKVRRLSLVSRNNEMPTVSEDLSHVRSLVVFGYYGQNSVLDFPALRVLDLGKCQNQRPAIIENLLLLKYLRLGWISDGSIAEIPAGIGKLHYLETLDMSGIEITKLPSSMARLQRLTRLYADFDPASLLDGIIGQLQSLEELENVHVSHIEIDKFLRELDQLTKLRTLSVTMEDPTLWKKVDVDRFVGTLISSYNLHHLTIRYEDDDCMTDLLSLESFYPANPAAFRKIYIHDYYINKVPNWMISLVNLRVLDLRMYCMGPEDIAILGGIPALVFLRLETYYGRSGKIFFRGFKSLNFFDLDVRYCGTAVEFEEGSMPKLENLILRFEAHKMKCVNYASDFGIQHLSALTKVDVRIFGKKDIVDKIHGLIKTALGKFRNPPTVSWDRGNGFCHHFETAIKRMYEEEPHRSFLGQLVEEINQDALPRLRMLVRHMLRSLDDIVKSLRVAGTPAADEWAAVARALSEIQREISAADIATKAAASNYVCALTLRLLDSPSAGSVPDDLVIHLAQDLVPHLARGSPQGIAEAARVLAASPSVAVPVLFKPLAECLASPDRQACTAAAAAFCELLAPPADAAPFLADLYNLLTTSRSNWALINVLKVFARLAPLESSLAARIVHPVCQLLARSSAMSLTLECIRTVLAALPAHGAVVSLAIGKVKEFLAAAHDPNLGLLSLGMLAPGYASTMEMCRDVIALSLGDAHSNIRREALHLLMGMIDGDNVMSIAGMLVSHAAKSDAEFANEILGAVLAACSRNVYKLVMDFDWYVSLLADMSRSLHCAQGGEIGRQLVDVGLRVQDARPGLVRSSQALLIDPAFLGNHLLCPVLSATAWVSGEYVNFTKDHVELLEALLQPSTNLLPMSVRSVYIQAVLKVIIFCSNSYLERLPDSHKEMDVEFSRLAIDQTVSGGSEAAIGSGDNIIIEKDPFSQRSILYMTNLIETTVGSLVDCSEVEVLERAHDLIDFVHLIKETQGVSDEDKHRRTKELVKNIKTVFCQELSHVSSNLQSHSSCSSMKSKQRYHDNDKSTYPPRSVGKEPRKHSGTGRSGHCQGKHKKRERTCTDPDVLPQAPCNFETDIRQRYISAGTSSYFGDAEKFESTFKIKRRTFHYICCLVKPLEDISSYTLLDGRLLLLEDQVALALRMFMSGGPVETILSDVGVSRSTFGLIFFWFVDAILKQASCHICWPSSFKMESIKSKFGLIHGLPNCCGVVDTTYITTTPSAETNCDHEKNHIIAVQVVVDPDNRIIDSFVELLGSQNQPRMLHYSVLSKQCGNGFWLNGSKLKLSDGSEAGEYIIGDAGYPLLPWLLTPYQEKDLSGPKMEFNMRHSAARTVTERVLAKLKDTWKWMHGVGLWGLCPQELLHLSAKIIHVSCMLHNIVIEMEGAKEHIPNNHDINYSQQVCHLADKKAVRVRDIMSQHLANWSLKFGGTLSFLEDEQRFESFFKMKRRTFNYICCLVKSIEDVSFYTFLDGRLMCLEDQLAVALRMLISGGPVETVASDFSTRESTVSQVTCRFVEAMMKRANYHVRCPDFIKMEKIKSEFELIHRLPNCCGVIDTTYITTVCLSSAEPNCEPEKDYIMAVQVVVDSDTRITDVFVEWSVRNNQSSISHSSNLFRQCEKGLWLNGSKLKLSDQSEVGEYIIGGEEYPLLPWLLTPYREKDLSEPKVEFNGRLSAARAVTLRGLARLKDTWKYLHGELLCPKNPREFAHIIDVCCRLHNIVIDMEDKAVEEEYIPNSCDVNYSQEVCQFVDENAVRMRDVVSQHWANRSS